MTRRPTPADMSAPNQPQQPHPRDPQRRTLQQARRVLNRALAAKQPDPDVLAAAELLVATERT